MEKGHSPHSLEENQRSAWQRVFDFLFTYRHQVRAVTLTLVLMAFLIAIPTHIRNSLLRGLRAQPYLATMLFIFSILGLSLLWSTGQRLDAWAFLIFNLRGKRPAWLDWAMLSFTQMGSGITSLVIAVILYLLRYRRFANELILGTLTLWLLVELFKAAFRRSRPFIRLAQTRIVGLRMRGQSFPSGHTSQAFFLVTLLVQHFHLAIGLAILLYVSAGLVAITRMYVGAHYPRDVAAGAILGSIWGLLGILIDNYFLASSG
jgi:membrane-associated phospholipid phosphatase